MNIPYTREELQSAGAIFHAPTLNFATGRDITRSTALTNVTQTFNELCERLATPNITDNKLAVPYFFRTTGTRRKDKHFANDASLLIIDGDKRLVDGVEVNGCVTLELVCEILTAHKICFVAYTSHSHGKIENGERLIKFRLILPCYYPRARLADCVRYIIELLHRNGAMIANAPENSVWAQAWFMPACHPDRVHEFQIFSNQNGNFLNVEDVPIYPPPPTLPPKPPRKALATTGDSPIVAFNSAYTVHEVLIRNGYQRTGENKYLSPTSTSGIAGVAILRGDDGIERAFSHHNDALNDGKAHDAFDCFLLLECGGDMRKALGWNPDMTRRNRRQYQAPPPPEFSIIGDKSIAQSCQNLPTQFRDRLLVCNDFATGEALHNATGHPVFVALDGNLTSTARVARRRFPFAVIVVCGDHDNSTASKAAAIACGGHCLVLTMEGV